jgi:hypothetical protein
MKLRITSLMAVLLAVALAYAATCSASCLAVAVTPALPDETLHHEGCTPPNTPDPAPDNGCSSHDHTAAWKAPKEQMATFAAPLIVAGHVLPVAPVRDLPALRPSGEPRPLHTTDSTTSPPLRL